MKEKIFLKYWLLDMKRAFLSWKFLGGIVGTFMVLEFAALETKQWQISVLNSFCLVKYSMPFLLTLIFTTLVFGQCFCEDIDYHYIRLLIIRGNLKSYVISKIITIMLSSIVTITVAILLFVFILRINCPWISLEETTYEALIQTGSFRYFLLNHNFFIYYLFCGIQYGLWAGVMSIIAALFSLMYRDPLFVLSIPLIIWYCIQYYGAAVFESDMLNLDLIYDISYNIWNNDVLSFLYACFVSVILSSLLGQIIYKILQRQVI